MSGRFGLVMDEVGFLLWLDWFLEERESVLEVASVCVSVFCVWYGVERVWNGDVAVDVAVDDVSVVVDFDECGVVRRSVCFRALDEDCAGGVHGLYSRRSKPFDRRFGHLLGLGCGPMDEGRLLVEMGGSLLSVVV